ncbi:MAG: phosphoribosylaminoimidazolesuccinocarboxamide synthase [Bacilli bacterium]|nr:phosphoribosylaminoimidazolesuccinocarboxamide synthase [Bacilli bacterium]MDD4387691.1 phosphoribosylaminoimidazolesuccinocarboxamide synthase [Bacilli bacterium]
MYLVYKGKTKDVYALENGNYLLRFKDDVTGENGVFDPGSNKVALSLSGIGQANIRMSIYFFELLRQNGIKTHYLNADLNKKEMEVLPVKTFGNGLEVIVRQKAVGSFIRRYGEYVTAGTELNGYVETTLKNDAKGDPLITKDGLVILNIMTGNEYETIKAKAKTISAIIAKEFTKRKLELYDIKFEFGKYRNEIILIDEISSGNMRVYQNGRPLEPFELDKYFFQ